MPGQSCTLVRQIGHVFSTVGTFPDPAMARSHARHGNPGMYEIWTGGDTLVGRFEVVTVWLGRRGLPHGSVITEYPPPEPEPPAVAALWPVAA